MGGAELAAERESLRYDIADARQYDPVSAEVVQILNGDRLKLVDAEFTRRERLYTEGADVPDPHDVSYDQWKDLAAEVRARADILDIFALAGIPLTPVGRDEHAGPCPCCEGHDRFRVWAGRTAGWPRYWCRRCGVSGDAISAHRDFLLPGESFFAAVRTMALQLNLRTPDFGSRAPMKLARSSRRVIALQATARHAS